MKHSILSIVLYNITASSFAQAMQKVELAPSLQYLEVTNIKPFGAPFTHVPRIVFANPPHRILKLTDESCAAIRKAAQTVTHEQIGSSVRKQNAAQPLSSHALLLKHLEAAESYDWVHAMNFVNDHLQDRSVDLAFVKELNLRLGRLTGVNSGKFRQTPLYDLIDPDPTAALFQHYICREKAYLNFFRELGKGEAQSKPFCESARGIRNNQDRYLKVKDERYIETKSIEELLNAMSHSDTVWKDPKTLQPYKLNIHAADAWELEEKETNSEYKSGYIDVKHWSDKRVYIYCEPEEVEELLTQSIRLNSRSALHPIEQAAHIWVDIMRINPFNEANKRTAKAIATLILLKHGYLPPLLTSEDVEECKKILLDNIEPQRGYHYFTHYLARLVKRTQDQYAGQVV